MSASLEPGAQDDRLWENINAEFEKFEKISKETVVPSLDPSPVSGDPPPAFTHVRETPPGLNPAPCPGIEYARMDAAQKLEALHPDQLTGIPEVEEGAVVAVRDLATGVNLHPGEHLISRTVKGQERYMAACRGKVLLVGKTLHVLPSDRDGKAFIRIASNNMRAHLNLWPRHGRGRASDFEGVMTLLRQSGIKHGILEQTIREALDECGNRGQQVADALIAVGTAPVHGTPVQIEYFFDRDSSGPVNLSVGADGKIDFRNVKWVPIVSKDYLLAKSTPAVVGVNGMNVLGEILPARQPPSLYLVTGQNVRCEKDGTEFYAEINGCAQLTGMRLDVMNMYVVNSDVDYHTGNVRFDGNVLITGTVRKGFEVEVEGDAVVLKNIEPCKIKAGRDVIVKGGVLGSGKSDFRIQAGQNITVGYTENACLEAQGDIRVENYAMQSFLYSCGFIRVDQGLKGSVVGGETIALKGLQAKFLGSSAGIATPAAAGINFSVKRKAVTLARQKTDLLAAMEKVDHFIRSLMEAAQQKTLPPAKVEGLKVILEKRKIMAKTHAALVATIEELEGMQNEKQPVYVRVTDTTHSETLLSIQGRFLKITKPVYRSEFYLDPAKTEILRRAF